MFPAAPGESSATLIPLAVGAKGASRRLAANYAVALPGPAIDERADGPPELLEEFRCVALLQGQLPHAVGLAAAPFGRLRTLSLSKCSINPEHPSGFRPGKVEGLILLK